MYNILVTTTSFQDSKGEHHNLLSQQKWNVDYLRGPLKEKELLSVISKYDGVLCGDDEYTKKVIEKGCSGNLKVISKYGVGLDKIDLVAATKFNLKVVNCPGINQRSVAEHVISLIFTFEKNIHLQFNSVQNYSWKRMVGRELFGKKFGIIGLGNIGKELAKLAYNIGFDVSFFDIDSQVNFINLYPKIKSSSIEEIFQDSEYISLNLPLNINTSHIINKSLMKKSKYKPVIINTARAGLVKTDDIIDCLDSEIIRGYLCDVLENEPIINPERLVGRNDVIITPHIGSRTLENIVKQGIKSIENLINTL